MKAIKKWLIALVPIVIAMSVVYSCDKERENEKPIVAESITISPGSLSLFENGFSVKESGASQSVSFTASGKWSVTVSTASAQTKAVDWIKINPPSGNAGSATIAINVSENKNPWGRSATIIITCGKVSKEIKIVQEGITTETDNSLHFEDPAFESFLIKHYDTNKDGKFTKEEALDYTGLIIYNAYDVDLPITSLSGIEYFTNLQWLEIVGSDRPTVYTYLDNEYEFDFNLSRLDLSKNTNLQRIQIYGTRLIDLDLSNNTKLKEVEICGNLLERLNLGNLTKLEKLNIEFNRLKTLNLEGVPKLRYLNCDANSLTDLDLSVCVGLESLSCSYNLFKKLDFLNSVKASLKTLVCKNDDLKSLALYKNSDKYSIEKMKLEGFQKLESIECSGIKSVVAGGNLQLKEAKIKAEYIDLSHCKALKNFDAEGAAYWGAKTIKLYHCSAIDTLDFNGLLYYNSGWHDAKSIENLVIGGCSSLIALSIYGSQLKELDLKGCKKLEELNCWGDIDWEQSNLASNLVEISNLTDCHALKYINVSNNKLSSLNLSNCSNIRRVSVGRLNISGIKGYLKDINVRGCKYLTYLDCYGQKLESLDIRGCSNLDTLRCARNLLTELETYTNEQLSYLDCRENKIKELDLRRNTTLKYLDCSFNNISSLENIKQDRIKYLDCSANQLKEIYFISQYEDLEYLFCSDNLLTSLNLHYNLYCFYLI